MALIGTFNLMGVSVPTAYAQVNAISGNTNGWVAQIGVYAQKPADVMLTPTPPAQNYAITFAFASGQDVMEDALDAALAHSDFSQMAREAPKRRISKLAFWQRFTQGERVGDANHPGILAVAKTNVTVEDYLEQVRGADYIDLSRQDTINGVQALEYSGLIAPGRAAEILA